MQYPTVKLPTATTPQDAAVPAVTGIPTAAAASQITVGENSSKKIPESRETMHGTIQDRRAQRGLLTRMRQELRKTERRERYFQSIQRFLLSHPHTKNTIHLRKA